MLTVTESASALIKNLADQTAVTETAGLRISTTENNTELAVELAPEPEPHDQVLEAAGARVFLEQHAAVVLTDKVLDTQLEEGGGITFAIEQRA